MKACINQAAKKNKINATLSPSKKLSVASVEIWNEQNQYGQIPIGSTGSVTHAKHRYLLLHQENDAETTWCSLLLQDNDKRW